MRGHRRRNIDHRRRREHDSFEFIHELVQLKRSHASFTPTSSPATSTLTTATASFTAAPAASSAHTQQSYSNARSAQSYAVVKRF